MDEKGNTPDISGNDLGNPTAPKSNEVEQEIPTNDSNTVEYTYKATDTVVEPNVIEGKFRDLTDEEKSKNQTPQPPITPQAAVNSDTTDNQSPSADIEENKEEQKDRGIRQKRNPKAQHDVIGKDGKKETVELPSDKSEKHVTAGPDYEFKDPEPKKAEKKGREYKKSEHRGIWETSLEEAKDLLKKANIPLPEMKKDERSGEVNDLPKEDQLGRRIMTRDRRRILRRAEQEKVKRDIGQWAEVLQKGRKLEKDELNFLVENELKSNKKYQKKKQYYKNLGLSDDATEHLLNTMHFKDEVEKVLNGFKDKNGDYNSTKLSIDQLYNLKKNYEDFIWQEWRDDWGKRVEEWEEAYKDREINKEKEKPEYKTPEEKKNIQEEKRDEALKELKQKEKEYNEAKERKIKRGALIAGVVAGGATGVLAGPAAIGVAGTAVFVGGALSFGAEFVGKKRIAKLQEKINQTTDAEEKAKFEKRYENWQKVIKWADRAKSFLKGAGVGLLAGSIINNLAFGGEGLIAHRAERKAAEGILKQGNPTGDGSFKVGDGANDIPGADTSTPTPTNTGQGAGQADVTSTPEFTNNLSPESLPDRISFNEYPQLKQGLIRRGMTPESQTLLLHGTEGGWANAQGEIIKKMLDMGINVNSQEAGWAIGDLAANSVHNNVAINEQTISSAIEAAKSMFGN
jgi:hypothetical protein